MGRSGGRCRDSESGEMKFGFIENKMPRDVETFRLDIKTQVTFETSGLTKKDAFHSPRFKLVSGVAPKIWITSTTKDLKL